MRFSVLLGGINGDPADQLWKSGSGALELKEQQ